MYHRGRENSLNETQPLLQPLYRTATFRTCCHRQHQLLCVRSKPAFLVTVWKFIVAAVYGPDMVSAILVLLKYGGLHGLPRFMVIALTSYTSLALWTLFFPLSGFIADVYVGRFKTLLTSLWLIWIASLVTSVGAVTFYLVKDDNKLLGGIEIPFIVLGSIFGLVLAVGLAGFKANVVQFGTDQMLDAPGEELSFFIHWFVWADYVGHMVSEIFHFLFLLTYSSDRHDCIYAMHNHSWTNVYSLLQLLCAQFIHNYPCTSEPLQDCATSFQFCPEAQTPNST